MQYPEHLSRTICAHSVMPGGHSTSVHLYRFQFNREGVLRASTCTQIMPTPSWPIQTEGARLRGYCGCLVGVVLDWIELDIERL